MTVLLWQNDWISIGCCPGVFLCVPSWDLVELDIWKLAGIVEKLLAEMAGDGLSYGPMHTQAGYLGHPDPAFICII